MRTDSNLKRSEYPQASMRRLSLRPLFPTKNDIGLFVGREKEMNVIESCMRNRLNLLLVGERGTGKTSLLNYTYYKTIKIDNVVGVLVNILPKSISDTSSFLNLVLDSTLDEIRHKHFAEQFFSEFDTRRTNDVFIAFNSIITILKQHNVEVVFLIDGFDHRVELCYRIMSSLREVFWQTEFPVIMTGDSNKINEYRRPPLDAFFDKKLEPQPLSSDEIMKLFELRLGKKYLDKTSANTLAERTESSIIDKILLVKEFFEKNPKTRKILLSKLEPKSEKNMSMDTLNQKTILKVFESSLVHLSPAKKEILRYIRINGPSSASDKEFQKYMGVSRSRLTQMLLSLSKNEILMKSKDD